MAPSFKYERDKIIRIKHEKASERKPKPYLHSKNQLMLAFLSIKHLEF